MTMRELEIASVLGPLNDIQRKNAPPLVYCEGDLSILEKGPRVSIVGSRDATAEGLARARALAKAFAGRGIVVVSGLARGIDTAAHETTIEHGGRTIGVIGTSLDQAFPPQNRALQERIGRDHLLISQFAPGTPSKPKNFPIRNKLMALLTDATVIVEASETSGTRHQGWEALRLGRLVFLLESVARDPALTWPREMIGYGAQVLSRANLDRMIDNLPWSTRLSGTAVEA